MRTLVWHRRDLRVDDHPALAAVVGAVVGFFVFDPAILYAEQVIAGRCLRVHGGGKVAFMLGCLAELGQRYRKLGSELLLVYGDPVLLLPKVAQRLAITHIHAHRDGEPGAIARDRAVTERLSAMGVMVRWFDDLGLHTTTEIVTKTQEPYRVFTPFWRNWAARPKPQPVDTPSQLVGVDAEVMAAVADLRYEPSLEKLGFSHAMDLPVAGEAAGLRLLTEFCVGDRLRRYDRGREFPAAAGGTSQLSPHLRFGTVGIRRVWQQTVLAAELIRSDEEQQGILTWRQELAWREFYQHVLYFFPELATGAYRPQMQCFTWEQDWERFEFWCQGQTGYLLVDAAMRQLKATGWMHNRCRMVVASFLTKDLLLSWQWGEWYFMHHLIDGDLAANNGGWQWSASSGMDPKPLRIFNPHTQAKKFDPEGEYIRQWIPELRGQTAAELFAGDLWRPNYPRPMVDHNRQQLEFKRRYQVAKEQCGKLGED
ncbi:MAG: deoxyribodipyrimidine photolyase [Oscillatoriales cyanobacterium SM2_2_1]|nr:deoxyribodipyrimidine photolyase [Oscillatoriales cyanobacterium SM2_2_1]